jgi:RNA recognition motif-containing protein
MRSHAFVTFESKNDADKARAELNGVKISAKYSNNKVAKPVRLCKYETRQTLSTMDRRANLLVTNVSKDVSPHAFYNMFRKYGDIYSCKLVVDYVGNSKGFGYVSYYSLIDAEKAKTELNGREKDGKIIKVSNLEYGRRSEKKRNNVYVKHIPKENFTNADLEAVFKPYGEVKSAIVLLDNDGNSKGFGFVCFDTTEEAEEAFKVMNGKSVWENIPPLYVNFAMKKSERLEHLQKKREEMYKMAQKMTIFVKIKDENSVKNDADFESQIRAYLKRVLQRDYEPKSIKIRFDTKNAFVTMNTQREAEEFIKKFQELSKESQTNLFFNLYKSKVERISANSYFKKYNNFNNFNMDGKVPVSKPPQKRFNQFNDFSGNVTTNESKILFKIDEFPYSSLNQNPTQPKRFNDFGDMGVNQINNQFNNMNMNPAYKQPQFNAFNNFNDIPAAKALINIPQIQQKRFDTMDDDEIGEFIFNFVENIYPV